MAWSLPKAGANACSLVECVWLFSQHQTDQRQQTPVKYLPERFWLAMKLMGSSEAPTGIAKSLVLQAEPDSSPTLLAVGYLG